MLIRFYFLISLFAILLSACQAPKESQPEWTSETGEVRPGPGTGKAVMALLKKARNASHQGQLSKAESYLERALRIEPRNPALWLYMAKLRLFATRFHEAVQLAKKSLTLSSTIMDKEKKRLLQLDAWRVLAHSYQKMDKPLKARQAQDKANSLSD